MEKEYGTTDKSQEITAQPVRKNTRISESACSDLLVAINDKKNAVIKCLNGYPSDSHMASLLAGKILGLSWVQKYLKSTGN